VSYMCAEVGVAVGQNISHCALTCSSTTIGLLNSPVTFVDDIVCDVVHALEYNL
jgi:hypothetical protein